MSSHFNHTVFIFALCTFLAISTGTVAAQSISASLGQISLTSSADSPSPGQKVTITAQSYSFDMNAANISWSINGKSVQKGIGLNTLTVITPEIGKRAIVTVAVTPVGASTLTGSINIIPGAIDMIVENNGFVPALFKGKIGTSYQNTVRISAIPHLANSAGVEYDPKTLIYQWQRNSQAIQDQSGYGKQSITILGDIIPRPYSLSVTVSTRDNTAQTTGRIAITPQAPSIGFYVDDPLYGPLFNKAITGTVRIGSQKETGVLAVPFGFNRPGQGWGDIAASWLVNGVEHPELSSNETIVVRAPEGGPGTSNIELDLQNPKLILQTATAAFSAIYNQTP